MTDEKQPPTTALATRPDDTGAAFAALARYQNERFNVLVPVQLAMDGSGSAYREPVGFKLVAQVVAPDPKDSKPGGSVYSTGGDRLALTGKVLDQIASAAGLEITVERIDDRRHPHYSECRATAKGRDWQDGQVRSYTDTKTVDLRSDAGDGEPGPDLRAILAAAEKGNRDPAKQIQQFRQYIHEMCASKARNRAIRHFVGVNTAGYTKEELARPFVVPKLQLDASNPRVAEAMLAQATGGAEALWGRARGGAGEPGPVTIEGTCRPALPAPAADPEAGLFGDEEPAGPRQLFFSDRSVFNCDALEVEAWEEEAEPAARFQALGHDPHKVKLCGPGDTPKWRAICKKAMPNVAKVKDITHDLLNALVTELAVQVLAAEKGGAS